MMIKKITLLTALSVTAFPGWAQQEQSSTMVVTGNRFQQPINSVLAPTVVVTREDIDRWQASSLVDVMRRLPGVDYIQNGGRGQMASVYVRGTESKHLLVLVDGIPVSRPGLVNDPSLFRIPLSLVQRIEYIRGPRSAVYGSGAIGGVVNIITWSADEKSQLNVKAGSHHEQAYEGMLRQRFGDTVATLAGAYESTRGFNVQPDSPYGPDADRDGFRNKTFWGGVEHQFNDSVEGFFRASGYSNNTDYDQGSFGSLSGGDEEQYYNQSWDAGLQFNQGSYSSQLIANYQQIKDYNYSSNEGRYADSASLDRMAQRYIQWGNNLAVGHGAVSAGVDWKQERLSSGSGSRIDRYQRENTGLYLTGQQQFGDVTLEASGREDKDDEFGWHGTWQTAGGWEFVDGYRVTLSYGTAFLSPSLGQQFGAKRFGIAANPNLKPEESKQWEAGLEGLTGPLDWRLSLYRNEITNLIDYDNYTYYNINSATVKGLEWTGNLTTGPIDHQLTLQYVDPQDDETNRRLLRRAKQQVKYDARGMVGDVSWDVTYQYIGQRDDIDSSSFPSRRVKMGGLSLWDVTVAYPLTSQLTVRGKIANLFDKDYETVYGYQSAGREYSLSGSYTF